MKPMLARVYNPEKPPTFSNYCLQPKLDGVRCLVHLQRGKVVEVKSRNQKPLVLGAALLGELGCIKTADDIWLDGELYIHGQRFPVIQGMVAKQDGQKLGLEYHI